MGDDIDVRVRRVYEEPGPGDGTRVLIDRLWPRGLSKEAARVDEWRKDVAPSSELRRWYGHRPEVFEEFARRYRAELAEPAARAALERLRGVAARGPLTLLTATKNLPHGHVVVLEEALREVR